MESRSSPASPIVPSFPWTGAVLGKLIRVSNSNTINQSEVTTQEMSQTVETSKSNVLTTVETTSNEISDVVAKSDFQSTVDMDQTQHDLKSIAQRPVLIRTGEVLSTSTNTVFGYDLATANNMTTSTVPGIITAFTMPNDLLSGNNPISRKTADFNFLKADINFMVKVNCPPNVSGAMMAVYFPLTTGVDLDFTNLTLQALTSYPCKILDYSTDTSLEMTVPYINQYDYINKSQYTLASNTTYTPTYGAIALFNLQTPLSASSGDSVSYSVFANFENIELALPVKTPPGPGIGPFIAQSQEMVRRIPGKNIMSGDYQKDNVNLSYTTIQNDFSKVSFDKEEDTLKYVLSRENVIGKINYDANKDINNSAYLGKVRCFPKRPIAKQGGTKPIQMGTFDYVSNLFARYTGTVKIGIRLIKTKFHYGRIAVVFDPFNRLAESSEPTSATDLLSTNYNMIIDLNANDGKEGGSNYYSINVPYINNAGFSTIGRFSNSPITGADGKMQSYWDPTIIQTGQECYNPYLRFYALTKLGYLSSAADTVPIFVSISAGDDYELTVPTVQVANSLPATDITNEPFYCQSSLDIVKKTSKTSDDSLLTCNGEKIVSLKQIANRFTQPKVYNNYKYLPYTIYHPDGTIYEPNHPIDAKIPMGCTLSLSINTPRGHKLSNYEAVANIYRYGYGGRRYKIYCNSSDNTTRIMARLIHVPNFSGLEPVEDGVDFPLKGYAYAVAPASTSATAIHGQMHVVNGINNILEVERPFYSNRKLISNRLPTTTSENGKVDEVLLQAMAVTYQGVTERSLIGSYDNGSYGGTRVTVGPGIVTSNRPTISPNNENNIIMDMGELMCFEERTFDTSDATSAMNYGEIQRVTVLEALGTQAGFTFLQAPPCVVFG